jgi:hypothetical protein
VGVGGYTATSGPDLLRPDLTGEAIRLARALLRLVPVVPVEGDRHLCGHLCHARLVERGGADAGVDGAGEHLGGDVGHLVVAERLEQQHLLARFRSMSCQRRPSSSLRRTPVVAASQNAGNNR